MEQAMGEELDEILRAQRIQPDAAEAFAFGAAEFFFDFGGDFLEGALPGGLVFHELDEEEVARQKKAAQGAKK